MKTNIINRSFENTTKLVIGKSGNGKTVCENFLFDDSEFESEKITVISDSIELIFPISER